ncbi:MAG: peptidoglycan DD-metalloendopeptidase family protein [Rhodospirillales bacterium]|nr:peptidoglycan DD-metalloendopeptidase family protein [Rhodospirillales bacterium]
MKRQPPSPNKLRVRVWVLAAALGLYVPSALAQSASPSAKLQDVERKIQSQQAESDRQKVRAEKLKAEMDAVNAELVATAKRVQDQEQLVAELETELVRLENEANQKTQQLRQRRQQFSGAVMALTRIARFPTEALIAQPLSVEDTVRSALLLRAAVPAIEMRAVSLQDELQQLAASRTQVENRRVDLQGAADRLRAEEGRIEAMRKQKAALRAEALSKGRVAQTQANKLAREAKDIRELMDRLAGESKKAQAKAEAQAQEKAKAAAQAKAEAKAKTEAQPESAPQAPDAAPPVDVAALSTMGSISKARGQLPFPAVGKLVGLYGQALDGGQTRKGLSLETRDGAQVIAPFDGKVVFAGPFRGYGQLLIIDHGEGYHSLLAGLGRIDTEIGQPVLAGEPVAVMTGGDNRSSGEQAILYVEFRRDNQPINPLPWLASRKGTPKG